MMTRAGQSPLRKEDARLLRGGARFVDNVHLDRMAHGAFVRSPVAHAEIVSIDAARALAAGALAVLTARDLPFNDQRWIVRYWHPSIRNGLPKFLAGDRVRFVGEAVAFVVAPDRYRAEDFAQLVEVEYRPLPAVASIESATAEGAMPLHPEWHGNVAAEFEHRAGDAGGALEASAHRARRRFQLRSSSSRSPRDARGRRELRRRTPVADGVALDPAALQRAAEPLEPAWTFRAQRPRDLRRRRRRLRLQIAPLRGGDHRRARKPDAAPAGEMDRRPLREPAGDHSFARDRCRARHRLRCEGRACGAEGGDSRRHRRLCVHQRDRHGRGRGRAHRQRLSLPPYRDCGALHRNEQDPDRHLSRRWAARSRVPDGMSSGRPRQGDRIGRRRVACTQSRAPGGNAVPRRHRAVRQRSRLRERRFSARSRDRRGGGRLYR